MATPQPSPMTDLAYGTGRPPPQGDQPAHRLMHGSEAIDRPGSTAGAKERTAKNGEHGNGR